MSYTIAFPANGNGMATLITAEGKQSTVDVSTTMVGNCRMMTVTPKQDTASISSANRGPRGEMVPVPDSIVQELLVADIQELARDLNVSDSLLYNIRNGITKDIGSVRLDKITAAILGTPATQPTQTTNGTTNAVGGLC